MPFFFCPLARVFDLFYARKQQLAILLSGYAMSPNDIDPYSFLDDDLHYKFGIHIQVVF